MLMIQSIKDFLITWNADRNERAKLQHAYIVVALATIVIAGLVGLVDDAAGKFLVSIALFALGAFVANVVVWAMLYSLVITKLPSRKSTTSRK
jgi:hypothetical protein